MKFYNFVIISLTNQLKTQKSWPKLNLAKNVNQNNARFKMLLQQYSPW